MSKKNKNHSGKNGAKSGAQSTVLHTKQNNDFKNKKKDLVKPVPKQLKKIVESPVVVQKQNNDVGGKKNKNKKQQKDSVKGCSLNTNSAPVPKPKAAEKSSSGPRAVTSSSSVPTKPKAVSTVDVRTEDSLRCLRYTMSETLTAERHLLLKRNAKTPLGLLVANVPSYLDLTVVRGFFSEFVRTPIQNIEVQRSNAKDENVDQGHRTLLVLFTDPTGPQEALGKCESVGPYCAESYGQGPVKGAFSEWCKEYRSLFMPTKEMQQGIEEYMKEYDDRIMEARVAAKKGRSVPDEEGWITVTSASRKKARLVKLKAGENKIMGSLKNQYKKKESSVPFYKFQMQKSKLKRMAEMQLKFEEDKRRVAQAKAARNFKPL